ncbi:MAG: dihydrofolate reductase [Verrucomicrobiales bacterium]
MKISIIAALDENRLIGTGSGIPWELPRDRQHFRDSAAGMAMLLGRRTFEEMHGWFTDQRPIVLTRRVDYGDFLGVSVVGSIEAALDEARGRGESELLVAGGADVYALALPFADQLILTEVESAFQGEVYFPEFSTSDWEEVSRVRFEADAENVHAMSFVTYRRR